MAEKIAEIIGLVGRTHDLKGVGKRLVPGSHFGVTAVLRHAAASGAALVIQRLAPECRERAESRPTDVAQGTAGIGRKAGIRRYAVSPHLRPKHTFIGASKRSLRAESGPPAIA